MLIDSLANNKFIAIDELGREYIYKFIGIKPNETNYIILFNETLNVITEVNIDWFRQRKIKKEIENNESN